MIYQKTKLMISNGPSKLFIDFTNHNHKLAYEKTVCLGFSHCVCCYSPFSNNLKQCSLVISQPPNAVVNAMSCWSCGYGSKLIASSSRRIHSFTRHGDQKYLGPIICSDSMGVNPTFWHPELGGSSSWFDMEEWFICAHLRSWTNTTCLKQTGLANLNDDITNNSAYWFLLQFLYVLIMDKLGMLLWMMEKTTFGTMVSKDWYVFSHVCPTSDRSPMSSSTKCSKGWSENRAPQIQSQLEKLRWYFARQAIAGACGSIFLTRMEETGRSRWHGLDLWSWERFELL